MSAVAIVGCRARAGAGPDDHYPDPDWSFLASALHRAGVEATPVAWDDPSVDWARFDLAVIRSTWDSVDRPIEYLDWARTVAGRTSLLNPITALAWNLDKTYLRALAARGIPVVPTQWVGEDTPWTAPAEDFVVKPSISGGGRQTVRYQPGDAAAAAAHIRRIVAGGRTAMVQPYVRSVEGAGEVKLVFVEGGYSHTVRVGPQLVAGTGQPVPFAAIPFVRVEPTAGQLAAARAVLAAVDAEVAAPPLYARVDLVAGTAGEPLLGEVELIDPSLYLRLAPASADRLAAAIRDRIRA